jgi:hypothetical protein
MRKKGKKEERGTKHNNDKRNKEGRQEGKNKAVYCDSSY